jgi:hypothetical protein
MNKYKTELFDVTFNEPTGQEGEHVTITHRKSEDYLDSFTLAGLCIEVEDLLQDGRLSPQEAVKVISKSAGFFMTPFTP